MCLTILVKIWCELSLHGSNLSLCDFFEDKFMPFKTPLDSSRYPGQVPEECTFDLEMFFMSLKSSKVLDIHDDIFIAFGISLSPEQLQMLPWVVFHK